MVGFPLSKSLGPKKNALDFLEKEFSQEDEQEVERLLIFMEGIKVGLDLRKEEQKEAG